MTKPAVQGVPPRGAVFATPTGRRVKYLGMYAPQGRPGGAPEAHYTYMPDATHTAAAAKLMLEGLVLTQGNMRLLTLVR
jgi:hypothetical protein